MSIINLIKSFKCALSGIMFCIKNEKNFRIHIISALTMAIMSSFYGLTPNENVLLFCVIVFVLVTEIINTAIEWTVNLMCTDEHPYAKIAKDVAAAAVLVSALSAVVVGILLFGDVKKLIEIMQYIFSSIYKSILTVIYITICVLFIMGRKNNDASRF